MSDCGRNDDERREWFREIRSMLKLQTAMAFVPIRPIGLTLKGCFVGEAQKAVNLAPHMDCVMGVRAGRWHSARGATKSDYQLPR